jgi:iron complex transport system substrate-binding protein
MIAKEPGFQVIKAVRQGRIYLVDEKLVSRPTLGLLAGIDQVHSLLYGHQPQKEQGKK